MNTKYSTNTSLALENNILLSRHLYFCVTNCTKHRGEYTTGIFLDFPKAFDTINHNIMLTKLNYYGIRGIPLEWIKSYLEHKKQVVLCKGNNMQCTTRVYIRFFIIFNLYR